MVYGVFSLGEFFSDIFLYWFPFYYAFKVRKPPANQGQPPSGPPIRNIRPGAQQSPELWGGASNVHVVQTSGASVGQRFLMGS